MAMNVGELVATLDVDDKGYTRGLTTAVAEAKAAGSSIEKSLDDVDASEAGKRTGSGFAGALTRAVARGGKSIMSTGSKIGSGLAGSVSKGLSSVSNNVWIMAGVVAAALATLPALGAAAGTGIALGFGAGIAGVGFLAAAQADRVQDAFGSLVDDVKSRMTEIAAPLQDTLVSAIGDARELFDTLAPHLADAFEKMAPVLTSFSDQLFSALGQFGPVIDDATAAFNGLLEAIGPQLSGAFGGISNALSGLFGTISSNPDIFAGFVTGAFSLVEGLIRLIDWLSEAYVWIKDNIPGGILGLISPLGALASMLVGTAAEGGGLTDMLKRMGSAFAQAWEFISSGAQKLWDSLKPIVQNIKNALANSGIIAKVKQWWNKIASIVELAGESIGVIFRGIAKVLTFIWNNFGTQIIGIFSGLWTAIKGIISGALEVIKGIFNIFIGVFTGDWERAWNGIKQIFSGPWTAIKGIVLGALEIIKNIISAALDIITGIFGSAWTWIKSTTKSLWNGIKSAVSAAINTVWGIVKSVVSGVRSTISGAWSAIQSATSSAWRWIKDTISDAIGTAYDAVAGIVSNFTQIGSNIIDGIIDGITGAAGALYDKLKGIAKDALGAAKDALGINSPSKVFAGEIGQWIPAGIGAGIDSGERELNRRVEGMARGMVDPMNRELSRADRGNAQPQQGGPAVNIERFEATERMSARDVGEALYGLVKARG